MSSINITNPSGPLVETSQPGNPVSVRRGICEPHESGLAEAERRSAVMRELSRLKGFAAELICGIDELEKTGAGELPDNAAEVVRGMAVMCFGERDHELGTLAQSFEHATPLRMAPDERERTYAAGHHDALRMVARTLEQRAEEIRRYEAKTQCHICNFADELDAQAARIRKAVAQ